MAQPATGAHEAPWTREMAEQATRDYIARHRAAADAYLADRQARGLTGEMFDHDGDSLNTVRERAAARLPIRQEGAFSDEEVPA